MTIKHHGHKSKVLTPLYIVQECACISHWKKFIICGIVEKNQNFTLQKNNICSVKLKIYLLEKENFSALRAEGIFSREATLETALSVS